MTFDFISIGDTVTDDFIELDDVRIDTRRDPEDRGYPELCLRFGDKVPFKNSVVIPAVGNAANAAVAAARLGLHTAFISDVGDDDRGAKIIDTLKENTVDTTFVRAHQDLQSNYHYVLRYKEERTILVKHEEYPYALPASLEPPKWLYLSSVGRHGLDYHREIAGWLTAHPNTKLAFQPGTFQIEFGGDSLKSLYEQTDIFFCNKNEAKIILKTDEDDIKKLLAALRSLGPTTAVITDGVGGAYADDGQNVWFVPMYPDIAPPLDRTGAGDAFSSTVTAALALGESLKTALAWGPINSMSVTQYLGAREGLLMRDKLLDYLARAPETYRVQKIS